MLMPVLMTKLPHLKIIIRSREFGKNIWGIELLLKMIRYEFEAREKAIFVDKTKDSMLYVNFKLFVSSNKTSYEKVFNSFMTEIPII